MSNIFIVHGAYGNPDENWFPWLKTEMEKQGYNVIIPVFPTPEGQNLDNWLKNLEEFKDYIDEETIFIGHSIGSGFILNVIERLENTIKAAFLVAGWTGLLNDPLDKINETFVNREFDWRKIKENCKNFYVFNSDNDPYVPLELGESLAKNLGVDLLLAKGAGHFNKKAGYEKFELLLEKIILEK